MGPPRQRAGDQWPSTLRYPRLRRDDATPLRRPHHRLARQRQPHQNEGRGDLGAEPATFTAALHCIVGASGEGGRLGPYKAYEWNKMKTPTRILVGGPEVTSAFVLMGLALARKAMLGGAGAS